MFSQMWAFQCLAQILTLEFPLSQYLDVILKIQSFNSLIKEYQRIHHFVAFQHLDKGESTSLSCDDKLSQSLTTFANCGVLLRIEDNFNQIGSYRLLRMPIFMQLPCGLRGWKWPMSPSGTAALTRPQGFFSENTSFGSFIIGPQMEGSFLIHGCFCAKTSTFKVWQEFGNLIHRRIEQ